MSDFTKWINEFITPGTPHEILPGRRVHLGVQATPVGLTADQAVEMAMRLLECAGISVAEAVFADGREPTTNERHLLNLLSWRNREAATRKEEIAVLEEQLNVTIDRSQSWENLCEKYKEVAEARGEALDLHREKR